jgi:hypothetical protein
VCFPSTTIHKKWTSLLSRKHPDKKLCFVIRLDDVFSTANLWETFVVIDESLWKAKHITHPHGSWLNMQFHNSKFTSGIITLSGVHFPPLQRALSTVVMLHYIHTRDKTMYPELHVQFGYIFHVSCRVLKYGFISVFAKGGARLSAAGGTVTERCVFG